MLSAAPLLFALTLTGRAPAERQAVFTLSSDNAAPVAAIRLSGLPHGENARAGIPPAIAIPGAGAPFPRFELWSGFDERLKAAAGEREARLGFFIKKLDSQYADYSEQLLAMDKPLEYRVGLLGKRLARTPHK